MQIVPVAERRRQQKGMEIIMENQEKPLWMKDDLVKEIPQEKLEFLSQLFAQGNGKNQKDLLRLLMPAMKKAKQENLTFTMAEMQAAIAAIKKYSSQEEQKQIDTILEKAAAKNPQK